VSNLRRRLERLEGGRRGKVFPIIPVRDGETKEEAWGKYLAEHPEQSTAELVPLFIIGTKQDPPGPPPPRPKPKEPEKAMGPAPITIIY
jgi:hypothetical protein